MSLDTAMTILTAEQTKYALECGYVPQTDRHYNEAVDVVDKVMQGYPSFQSDDGASLDVTETKWFRREIITAVAIALTKESFRCICLEKK